MSTKTAIIVVMIANIAANKLNVNALLATPVVFSTFSVTRLKFPLTLAITSFLA